MPREESARDQQERRERCDTYWRPVLRNHGFVFSLRVATTRITYRRRKRALAANPASKETGPSKLKRGAAVRVQSIVRCFYWFDVNSG